MRRTIDRVNRALLVLIGLGLLVLGAVGLLRGRGGDGAAPVVSPWLRSWARDRQGLLLVVLAATAVLFVWLGLTWLLAQLPRGRPVAQVTLERTAHATRVEVSARALADAVAADVRRLSGVADATARVVAEHPLALDLDVALEEGTDLTAMNRAIAERPRRNLLDALELTEVDLRVRLRPARPPARRVA